MNRVLMTGASGFIGRHCLQPLMDRGYEVHAVSSTHVPIDLAGPIWHQANLLDPQQVKELMSVVRPTHLLHLAWYAVPGKYWTSLENFKWVQASLTLLQAFTHFEGQRVVTAGTCAEYEWAGHLCSEYTTRLMPATVYGTCKGSLQAMQSAFAQQTGVRSAWGRIFLLYGPYEPPQRLVSSVIRSLLRDEPALCSHGLQIRDFHHLASAVWRVKTGSSLHHHSIVCASPAGRLYFGYQ